MLRPSLPTVIQLRETRARVVQADLSGSSGELTALLLCDRKNFSLVRALAQKVSRNARLDEHFLQTMSDAEVAALARFLTLIDGVPHGIFFGSAPAVPTLVAELKKRNYQRYEEVLDWIFRTRMSPWLPFGNQFGGEARTLLEYRQLEEDQRIRLERRGLDEQLVKVERQRSGCAKATHDLKNAIRRKDLKAFPRLVDRGADILARHGDGKTLIEKMNEVAKVLCTPWSALEESAR